MEWLWKTSLPVILLVELMMMAQEAGRGDASDLTALLDFKNRITDDPAGIIASWNDSSSHYCNWTGITCDPSRTRVRILSLMSQNLVGSLPPSIGNLSFLRGINLRFNTFRGQIPREIGLLSSLKHLNLTNNMLSGSIPSTLSNCTQLTLLHLDQNQLSGQIPSQLGSLPNLEILSLSANNLTGRFPVWFANLSSRFVGFSLVGNSFHGSIPPEIGRLSSMEIFVISENQFSGELPSSIYNLSSMTVFYVADNRLQGRIPPDLGLKYPNLVLLACGVNSFTGEVPVSLANATMLQKVDFAVNSLTGTVPSVLGTLPFLNWINLELNVLAGDMNFISSLANCTHLQDLGLRYNSFGGELPATVANLSTELRIITFGHNQLHGNLPVGIGNLKNLIVLDLELNMFTGSIPDDIGKLQQLSLLRLSGNELTGMIPISFGNLTSLVELSFYRNRLQGKIPPQLGNCTRLLNLNISSNNLTGSIPKEVMSLSSLSLVLGLARNSFSGPLPVEVSRLTHLKELDVSGNKLSGEIPSSLSKCLSLEILLMGGNRFTGAVPESLEALRGLEEIDVSHNNLSGKIPDFLGKLPFLRKLDLSYNNLQGEVLNQGIFSNASAVSVLGNKQLCGGAPSLHLPLCSIPTRKWNKNLKLIRWLIPVTVSAATSIVLICSLSLWYIFRKPKKQDASPLKDSHLVISYRELHRATNGFSADNLIGSGSFGSVYKGTLEEDVGSSVAVKVLNLEQRGAITSFLHECEILRSIRHRNLLKIITVCSGFDPQGQEFKSLITEFMANGSLDAWLHPTTRDGTRNVLPTRNLNIMERLNIAIDVASAVDYLHNHSHTPIIHCDLKPSNILLDEDLMAHVGDFGLAKFLLQTASRPLQTHSISIELRGSIGYIPPEYGSSTQISSLGDVYSYGILVLELFTGKRPTDNMFNDDLSIHKYVSMALPEHVMEIYEEGENGREIEEEGEIIEEDRGQEFQQLNSREKECLVSVLKIGVSCSMASAEDRMPISNVVNHLHSIRTRLSRRN